MFLVHLHLQRPVAMKERAKMFLQYFSGFSPVMQGGIFPLRTSIHVYSYSHEFKLPDGLKNGRYLHCAWKLTISKFSYIEFRDLLFWVDSGKNYSSYFFEVYTDP